MVDLIKLNDAEKELAVSRWTLYRWIKQGKIESVRLPGGHLRIPLIEIERIKSISSE